jgi:Fe-S cluster assembly iron-binding protein IscA
MKGHEDDIEVLALASVAAATDIRAAQQGGCSCMSYVMDFETDANIKVRGVLLVSWKGMRIVQPPVGR